MHADYILTTFSPAMLGERATLHMRVVDEAEAAKHVHEYTQILATRPSHERLAKGLFPQTDRTTRYAALKPGVVAIHIHYMGPMIPDSGELPLGGTITYRLIEVEEYLEPS